jgi:hypothetical protein
VINEQEYHKYLAGTISEEDLLNEKVNQDMLSQLEMFVNNPKIYKKKEATH